MTFFVDGYWHLTELIKHPKNTDVLNPFRFNFGIDDQPTTFLKYWLTSENEQSCCYWCEPLTHTSEHALCRLTHLIKQYIPSGAIYSHSAHSSSLDLEIESCTSSASATPELPMRGGIHLF